MTGIENIQINFLRSKSLVDNPAIDETMNMIAKMSSMYLQPANDQSMFGGKSGDKSTELDLSTEFAIGDKLDSTFNMSKIYRNTNDQTTCLDAGRFFNLKKRR